MTIKNGRNGKKFFRAQQEPQLDWAVGTGASAGFRPEEGVRFSQTKPSTKPGLKLSRQGAQKTRGANSMMRQHPMAHGFDGGPPDEPSLKKQNVRRAKKRRARSLKKR